MQTKKNKKEMKGHGAVQYNITYSMGTMFVSEKKISITKELNDYNQVVIYVKTHASVSNKYNLFYST